MRRTAAGKALCRSAALGKNTSRMHRACGIPGVVSLARVMLSDAVARPKLNTKALIEDLEAVAK